MPAVIDLRLSLENAELRERIAFLEHALADEQRRSDDTLRMFRDLTNLLQSVPVTHTSEAA
jgi:hypothetical protein